MNFNKLCKALTFTNIFSFIFIFNWWVALFVTFFCRLSCCSYLHCRLISGTVVWYSDRNNGFSKNNCRSLFFSSTCFFFGFIFLLFYWRLFFNIIILLLHVFFLLHLLPPWCLYCAWLFDGKQRPWQPAGLFQYPDTCTTTRTRSRFFIQILNLHTLYYCNCTTLCTSTCTSTY